MKRSWSSYGSAGKGVENRKEKELKGSAGKEL